MLAYLGLRSTAPEMLYFVAGLAFTASCAFGMATDAIMRGIGFGVIGNAIIGTVGAVIGAHLWLERTSYGAQSSELVPLLLCAAMAGTLLLLLAALLKKAVARA
jgi:uncharacterized membrane protein YeaQ/YmgE (transglycosylase-associated protein family)